MHSNRLKIYYVATHSVASYLYYHIRINLYLIYCVIILISIFQFMIDFNDNKWNLHVRASHKHLFDICNVLADNAKYGMVCRKLNKPKAFCRPPKINCRITSSFTNFITSVTVLVTTICNLVKSLIQF